MLFLLQGELSGLLDQLLGGGVVEWIRKAGVPSRHPECGPLLPGGFLLGSTPAPGPGALPPAWDCDQLPGASACSGLQHSLAEQGLLCGIPEAGGGSSSEPALSGGQRGCCGILSGDKALKSCGEERKRIPD